MPRKKQSDPRKTDEATLEGQSLGRNSILDALNSNTSEVRPGNSGNISTTFEVSEEIFYDAVESVDSVSEITIDDGGSETGSILIEQDTDFKGCVSFSTPNKRRQSKSGYTKNKKKRTRIISDPCLQDYLDHCDFFLTVQNTLCSEKAEKFVFPVHFLGSVKITWAADLKCLNLKVSPVVYIYVSTLPQKCILYIENSNGAFYWPVQFSAPYATMESIKNKQMFTLYLSECNSNDSGYTINVHINNNAFQTPSHPSNTSQNLSMLSAIEYFLNITVPECHSSPLKPAWPHKTIHELYDNVRSLSLRDQRRPEKIELSLDNLLPSLRPYQEDAVHWILSRERRNVRQQTLHPLYMELKLCTGQIIYLNKYSGIVCLEKPFAIEASPGGILADEMGLGKTVEMLACILANPRPQPSAAVVSEPEGNNCLFIESHSESKPPDGSNETRNILKDVSLSKLDVNDPTLASSNSSSNSNNPSNLLPLSGCERNISCNDDINEHPEEPIVANGVAHSDESKTSCNKPNLSTETCVDTVLSEHTKNSTHWESAEKLSDISKNENAQSDYVTSASDDVGETDSDCDTEIISDYEPEIISDYEPEIISDYEPEITSDDEPEIISDYEPDEEVQSVQTDRSSRNKKNLAKENKNDEDEITIDLESDVFECLCGQAHWEWESVQCTHCGSWQHKFCMDFGNDMDESEYLCPHCWVSSETPLVSSRATLVVTPSSIHSQWKEEIQRHLKKDSLKWTFYPGLAQRSTQFMQPQRLADYDLVLVTYETLRKEIDYVDLPHSNSDSGRRFRNPKRFMATPTPLLAIEWWRICLDEAQMVEGVTTRTAEMALRLSSVNRWCVTGTPIQKSIDDLYGLFLFLGEDPYWQKTWWKRLLYDPYKSGVQEPLLNVLKECFWRNTKNDVLHQIGLPPQTEVTHKLLFSPVEEHFYNRQHHECAAEALRRLSKFHNLDIKLKELDKQTMFQVMAPLARLRQACCHPQAVRGHLLPLQKKTITMEELLTSLIKKTKVECEDFHRQFISALNGLAGIHILNEECVEAVEKYREVLHAVKEQKDVLKTDKIQQYHTLYNLNQLLKGQVLPSDKCSTIANKASKEQDNLKIDGSVCSESISVCPPAGVGRTLEDESLGEQSQTLFNLYIEKCKSQVTVAQTQLSKAIQAVQEIRDQFHDEGENWWVVGCKLIMKRGSDEALVLKVKDSLSDKVKLRSGDTLSSRFNSLSGLMFMFTKLTDALKESHKALSKAVKSLSSTPSQEDINAAITCHLRPLVTTTKRCVYCRCHELFNQYEGKLFCFQAGFEKDPLTNEEALWGQTRKGTWADSELECALKSVLSFLRNSRVDPGIIENGTLHMKLLEALKKEFRCLRAVWMQIRDHASALDELEMAKTRFRLRHPDEPKPEIPLPYILEPEEVQPMKLKMMSDRAVAQNELRKKLGQLFYLQNLAKADFGKKGGSNPELCPICQKVLGTQWSVLQCGHCFCVECIRILIKDFSVGFHSHSVRCAICRQITAHAEISYVDTNPEPDNLENEISVKGSHSTKIEAVIRCLLEILKKEPEAKALVFSSWQLVLSVLEEALIENDISCVTLQSHKLSKSLWQFKHNPNVHVLLLPVRSGANGLNLVEATHVLMVEPLLNPAAEVQALGRVHRIGQTKPTTVHRFIVSSTIEERIHHACINQDADSDESMTLSELKKLFELK